MWFRSFKGQHTKRINFKEFAVLSMFECHFVCATYFALWKKYAFIHPMYTKHYFIVFNYLIFNSLLLNFQVGSLKGFYLFEHNHVHKRSVQPDDHHHRKLTDEPQVSTFIVLTEVVMYLV